MGTAAKGSDGRGSPGAEATTKSRVASSYRMGTSVAPRTAVLDRERVRLGTAVAHRTVVLESRGRIRGHPDWVQWGQRPRARMAVAPPERAEATTKSRAASSYRMGTSVAQRTAVLDRERVRLGTAVAYRTADLERGGRVRWPIGQRSLIGSGFGWRFRLGTAVAHRTAVLAGESRTDSRSS